MTGLAFGRPSLKSLKGTHFLDLRRAWGDFKALEGNTKNSRPVTRHPPFLHLSPACVLSTRSHTVPHSSLHSTQMHDSIVWLHCVATGMILDSPLELGIGILLGSSLKASAFCETDGMRTVGRLMEEISTPANYRDHVYGGMTYSCILYILHS